MGKQVALLLAVSLFALLLAGVAGAQPTNRRVYNPVTGRSELETRAPRVREPLAPQAEEGSGLVKPVSYGVPSESSDECSVGCGEPACCDVCAPTKPRATFFAGFEATFVKPRFENNVAFTTMEADGASFESFTDTEFDYDLEFTPRVFLGWRHDDSVGLRATWWQFDHAAATASANPPANGFGSITHPTFGSVDISSIIPTDTFTAAADLNAYTIDIEATRETGFCGWDLGVAGGLRYAHSEQGYSAELRDDTAALRGSIEYRQSIEGFGPTISLSAYRPIAGDAGFFCKARGSVLFGDGKSTLAAVEDADLTTPFNTSRTTNRDDLLSIGEIQLGFRWQSLAKRGQPYRPFLTAAMEGQIWNGAGSATSEDGSLGFFGFNTGAGLTW
jgi:hypothetical protein